MPGGTVACSCRKHCRSVLDCGGDVERAVEVGTGGSEGSGGLGSGAAVGHSSGGLKGEQVAVMRWQHFGSRCSLSTTMVGSWAGATGTRLRAVLGHHSVAHHGRVAQDHRVAAHLRFGMQHQQPITSTSHKARQGATTRCVPVPGISHSFLAALAMGRLARAPAGRTSFLTPGPLRRS